MLIDDSMKDQYLRSVLQYAFHLAESVVRTFLPALECTMPKAPDVRSHADLNPLILPLSLPIGQSPRPASYNQQPAV